MAIEALSADTISREEAIHAIDLCRERKNKEIDELRTKWLEAEQRADKPKGKWSEDCKCTICGFEDEDFGLSQIIRCNFCPNCGARMKRAKQQMGLDSFD
jgi:DNA-directed RNA polymerase subunit M/transcription elongation factor TFIIS